MIDWDRVRTLHDEIGADAFAEVLELFVVEVDESLARLAATRAPDARASEFHFLKGAALNLGLDDVATLCAVGEKSAGAQEESQAIETQVAADFAARNHALITGWQQMVALS